MNPIKGTGARVMPPGAKRSLGQILRKKKKHKKQQYGSLGSVLIEFCYLLWPLPHQPWSNAFSQQRVSIWLSAINQQLWHLLAHAGRRRHDDQRQAVCHRTNGTSLVYLHHMMAGTRRLCWRRQGCRTAASKAQFSTLCQRHSLETDTGAVIPLTTVFQRRKFAAFKENKLLLL